jgi:hypothetical protein
MVQKPLTLAAALAVVSLMLIMANRASAQLPAVACYRPPVVAYYAPPVALAPAPSVSYYYSPGVSYYAPPVSYAPPSVASYTPPASYYTPATAVTTTRYGLFGRPRVQTTYYGSGYVFP